MSEDRKDDKDYEVGYGKPPLHSRFQLGHQRGNRKGRKVGSTNLKSDLQAELSEKVTLTENGKKIRLTKQRALIKTMVIKGIKGDDRATAKAFDLLLKLFGIDDVSDAEMPMSPEDQAILDGFLKRRGGDHDDA
jgi:hypothetical protein